MILELTARLLRPNSNIMDVIHCTFTNDANIIRQYIAVQCMRECGDTGFRERASLARFAVEVDSLAGDPVHLRLKFESSNARVQLQPQSQRSRLSSSSN